MSAARPRMPDVRGGMSFTPTRQLTMPGYVAEDPDRDAVRALIYYLFDFR